MIKNKSTIILIAAIMAAVVTALFLVVPVTPLFIAGYAFAIFAIVLFAFGSIYMASKSKSYPWFAAFPKTAFRYLITQIVLSAIFILVENLADWALPWRWFLFLHILLLAIFVIPMILMKSGREIIENRDTQVKEKVTTLRFMQADVESLIRNMPEHERELKQVAEAIRYSDPMSHPSLAVYDEQIQQKIMAMGSGENISAQCSELLRLIANRNSRVQIMK